MTLIDEVIYSVIRSKQQKGYSDDKQILNSCYYYFSKLNLEITAEEVLEKIKAIKSSSVKPKHIDLQNLKSEKINKYKLPDGYVLRYAVNPNLAPTLMNLKGLVVHKIIQETNQNGQLYLRFDDTSPDNKPSTKAAYESYIRTANSLNLTYKLYYVSDNVSKYYEWGRQLLQLKKAFLMVNLKRIYDIDQYNRFLDGKTKYVFMVDGVKPWVGLRLCKRPHVRHPEVKIWPTLNFHSIIDDMNLGITHIFRGLDLKESEKIQKEYTKGILDYKFPSCYYWGRNKIQGLVISSSKLVKKNKTIFDFDFLTIDNLEYFGITINAIYNFWKQIGISLRAAKLNIGLLKKYTQQKVPNRTYSESDSSKLVIIKFREHITGQWGFETINQGFIKTLKEGDTFKLKNHYFKYCKKGFVRCLSRYR